MAELQNLNHENESAMWHRLILLLRPHHCVLEEYFLRAYKDVHEWADREGVDGRNSASRKKKCFELCTNKCNDTYFYPYSLCVYAFMMIFLVSNGLLETKEQLSPLETPHKIKEKLAAVRVKVSDESKNVRN